MIYKYLDLSTAYITQQQSEDFTDFLSVTESGDNDFNFTVYPYEEGFFVPVPSKEAAAPDNLKKIFAYARAHKCVLVRFDRDGDEDANFKRFDW